MNKHKRKPVKIFNSKGRLIYLDRILQCLNCSKEAKLVGIPIESPTKFIVECKCGAKNHKTSVSEIGAIRMWNRKITKNK